jgi:hypothetical protein
MLAKQASPTEIQPAETLLVEAIRYEKGDTATLLSIYFCPFRSQYLLDCYVRYAVRIALKSSVDAAY